MARQSRKDQYSLEWDLLGWTAPLRGHVLRIYVDPTTEPAIGANPLDIDIALKGGGTATLATLATEVWSYFRLAYDADISVASCSLYKWVTNNSRQYISGAVVTNPTGVAAGAPSVASQQTLTFRTAAGSIAKLVMLETNTGGDTITALVPNAGGSPFQRIAYYLLSASSPMNGIDNAFAVQALKIASGQNEAVWRRVYRA